MYELKDKIVVVTGASNGIGAAFVREILTEGVQHVRILDVDVGAGELLQNELNAKYGENKVKFVKCDVTNNEQFYKCLEDTKADNGYLDVLVNNAGVGNETNVAYINKLIEINYKAVVNGTLKAIELMRTDNGGRGGTIINTSSIGALIQVSPMFTYSSTKRAVLQFSHCIGQLPCENTGVRVLSVCFGVTDTAILSTLKAMSERLTEATQEILGDLPFQTAQSAARGMIDMFKQGESASMWLIQNSEPAEDITPHILKADADLNKLIRWTTK